MSELSLSKERDDLFSEYLRKACWTQWQQATEHKFVEDLASDQIRNEVYSRYLVLDYAFLDILVSHVGQAVTTAPTMIEKRFYANFLTVLTGDEDDYFLRAFDAMGIPEQVWRKPVTDPLISGFRDVMLTPAGGRSYANVLASLLPVEWVYLTWAKSVAHDTPARFYLKEWIDLHVDPGFEAFVTWMQSEMDRIGPTLSTQERENVEAIFTRTVELEVAFFDAAYEL